MKRWMLWVGGLVLAAAIATPWAVGILTEQQWGEATREVNAAQPFLDFSTGHYQRHLFSAELEGRINLRDPQTGTVQKVHFKGTVHHGVTGSRLELHPVPDDAGTLATLFPHAQPSIVIETHLWGTADVTVSVPAIELDDQETGVAMSIAASQASVHTSNAGDRLDMNLHWPGLTVQAPTGQLAVSDIRFKESISRLQGDVWTGGGHLGVASVSVEPQGHQPVALTDLAVDSSVGAKQAGERLDSKTTLSVARVTAAGSSSGPYRMEFAIRNASVAAWNDLKTTMRTIQKQALAAATRPDSAETASARQQQAMNAIAGAVRRFAAAGVTLGIPSLTANTPKGLVEGSVMLQHPALPVAKRDDIMLVMQRLTGDARLTVPASLVASNPSVMSKLSTLIRQGLVTRQGDSFLFKATLKDLALEVNGKEIPLPPLI